MATYGAIRNKGAAFLAQQDSTTKTACAVMDVMHNRKGFDWWFDDLETVLKNEIFDDIRKALKAANGDK